MRSIIVVLFFLVYLGLDVSAQTAAGKKPAGAKTAVISLTVVKNAMQFDKKLIKVKAGSKVSINLENPDGMPHNLVIIKPGTMPKVGAAADAIVADPKAAEMAYVPKMPEILFSTKLVNPGQSTKLEFVAPAKPGDYPFLCTFPGHWRIMNGVMQVEK